MQIENTSKHVHSLGGCNQLSKSSPGLVSSRMGDSLQWVYGTTLVS